MALLALPQEPFESGALPAQIAPSDLHAVGGVCDLDGVLIMGTPEGHR